MAKDFFQLLYLPANFNKFLGIFNSDYQTVGQSREPNYKSLINKYDKASNYSTLVSNPAYINLAYAALKEFSMNEQGARLVAQPQFQSSILKHTPTLSLLSSYRLESIDDKSITNIFSNLWVLFQRLQIMASSSKLVGVSKAMHFLLPNLVMPIDRKSVLRFYYGQTSPNVPTSLHKQFQVFQEVLQSYRDLAQHLPLNLSNWDGNWWNKSVPKRIDNAIAGFWKALPNISFQSTALQSPSPKPPE
jgi:hypothetical protein